MRILILSCNTGGGHNSCAEALKEVFETHGDTCDIRDALAFISGGFSHVVSWVHTTMYRRIPGLFRYCYGYADNHPGILQYPSAAYKLITSGSERLYKFLKEQDYDVIIGVHVFSALIISEVRRNHDLNARTCFVATDYTCSPGVKGSDLDVYCVPDTSLIGDFEGADIPHEKIRPSGIPVRQCFYARTEKRTAKEQFDVPPTRPHLLLMCGSMGCGPIRQIVKQLSSDDGPFDTTVVCGTNSKLEKSLRRRYGSRSSLHIRGFEKNMSLLMDSADLCITKPGGLSVAEACVKELPVVCIDAVAGCEEHNCQYLMRKGVARTGGSVKELCRCCEDLLVNADAREELETAFRDGEKSNAAENIYLIVRNMLKE